MAEIWGAAIVVGGTLIGGAMQADAAKKAGNAAAAGSAEAIAEQRRQFDLTRLDTAPYRGIGQQALGALGSIYGYNSTPTSTPQNRFLEQTAGAVPLNPAMRGTSVVGGKYNIGGKITSGMGSLGAVLDPAQAIFGSKHGDENRNMKAFAEESGAMQLPDGRIALPDGTIFGADKLEEVAGTWYGAMHAPDGDQAGWKAKFDTLTSGLRGGQPPIDMQQGADGTWVPTPGGGVDQRMALAGPTTGTGGANGTGAGAPSPDYSNFFASPDFKFRQQQGDQAITRNASALGGLASGNTGTALTEYSSDLASGEFGNYFNRQAALAGIGQTAVNTATSAGMNAANNIGNAAQNAGDARASGIAAGADAWGNALGTVAGVGYNYFNQPKRIGRGGYGTQAMNNYGSPTRGLA